MSRAAAALLAALVVTGCAHAREVRPEVVRSGVQCGGDAEGTSARWIGSEPALREALSAEGRLGAPAPAPSVDFAREGVVLFAMGRRPTAGYAVALAEPVARVEDGVATIVVRLDRPAPDAILAQVVTSPCLAVRVPREGLREVRIVDPAGALLGFARLP